MKNRMSKLLQNIEEVNDKDDKHQAKVEGRSSIIGVIVSLCMKTLYIELTSSQRGDDSEHNILDRRVTNVFSTDTKEVQSNTLNKKICVLILNNLTKYEDVGEIVDITYEWLSLFCKNEILESSKILITQAVKHIAVYKSDSAFKFMTLLVKSSSKYKNKSEIENALRNLMNKNKVVPK
mmetsp:Transcript_18227/g.20969  ORF Transcript_18227/g.20969 Transcript_18227/m.20969 type:complete len:179 (+) Transcript_18227:3068-3604(+)